MQLLDDDDVIDFDLEQTVTLTLADDDEAESVDTITLTANQEDDHKRSFGGIIRHWNYRSRNDSNLGCFDLLGSG